MKSYITFLLNFVLFFSISINAQNIQKYSGLLSYKYSGFSGQNLKDSIKSVHFKYIEPKEILAKKKTDQAIANAYGIEKKPAYIYFDEYQRILKRSFNLPSYNYLNESDNRDSNYFYDPKDWFTKSNSKTTIKQYYPVRIHNLLIQLNQVLKPNDNEFTEEKGKIWPDYFENVFTYKFDKSGKIIEGNDYCVFRKGKRTLDKKYTKEDLITTKIFNYNEKDQVISQKIVPGPFAKRMSYTDMGTECPFCKDLQLQYNYDSQERVTEVTMYACGRIITKEEYSYHPTKDYVETVKYYVTGPGEISNPTKNFIKTFNEQGDMIQKEFIPDFPEQTIEIKQLFYTYEYDSHNNWIKCNMYLEGTKEGEPTLVAERKIEYYN